MGAMIIYAVGWVGMVILAILNGAAREKMYGPLIGELSAHQLSTVIGLALFGLYIWIITGIFGIESSGQAFAIGGMWLIMTILFEFVFGHFIMGHSWGRLFHDYNLFKGRIWILIPLGMTILPYLFYRCRT